LGLIGTTPILLVLTYKFMDSASKRDWSSSGQGYLMLFIIFPLFTFLLLRFGIHIARDHRILAGLVVLLSIALTVVASMTIHLDYYEQTMIPVLAILYVFTLMSAASYFYVIIEKRSGAWSATKLVFLLFYAGYFLSLPSLYSSYGGGAVILLATISMGLAVIIDLVFEMRVKYGRGLAKSLAEVMIAATLAFLMALPIMYTMVMAFY
jgi:hypothetical protein